MATAKAAVTMPNAETKLFINTSN
ncbi:hypothetical protein BOS5A_210234 [Bosea sp. EC-HK365B]|nr:hypothetical protein BOSE7B_120098 [Bosea sp. 7B]CAD5280327.1 hypothetical protein BOSE21B_30819 [Bosea sp. 21B]VVT59442.1 hypothetical protein BOS5A_210234 [Bosea sp. EC-HK365B]